VSTATVLTARVLTGDEWATWRDLRLRALADSPDAFGSTLEREQAFTEDDWRSRVSGPSVVAFADGEPVGLGGGYRDLPGWLHVVAMWTEPAWRGHGAGRLVMEVLRGWAAEHGLRLHLDVTVGNDAARRVYEAIGFVATGETRPLRPGSPYDVERMVLP
jgi:GNAT superfamily N-acetyltransferase